MTEYVVMSATRADETDSAWAEVGHFEARDARAAVAAYVSQNGVPKSGSFIAVPLRSFKPIKVDVETQTKLKFT